MTRTLIDDDALAAAARELGTTTKVDTVNKALAEIAARQSRVAFLDHMASSDDDLGDDTVMDGAWR